MPCVNDVLFLPVCDPNSRQTFFTHQHILTVAGDADGINTMRKVPQPAGATRCVIFVLLLNGYHSQSSLPLPSVFDGGVCRQLSAVTFVKLPVIFAALSRAIHDGEAVGAMGCVSPTGIRTAHTGFLQ